MTNPTEIIRCLKLDLGGDLEAGARYAERIAANARDINPQDAEAYAEAGRRLRGEIEANRAKRCPQCGELEPRGMSCLCWDNHCE